MSNVATLRKIVEQLRREVNIDRVLISQASTDLRAFCEKNAKEDVLVSGFADAKDNKYRDKGRCTIL